MIITDFHKLSYTEKEDYPTFIAIIKKFGWQMTKLVTTENGRKYFNLSNQRGIAGLGRYSNKNKKKKPEFTIEVVEYSFMIAFIYDKKKVNTDMHYNFKELFKTGLPYELFNELFGIERSDTITDSKGSKEWVVRHHKKDGDNFVSYYLMVNNKFLYAVKVFTNEFSDIKEELHISTDWINRFKKYQYLCVLKAKSSAHKGRTKYVK